MKKILIAAFVLLVACEHTPKDTGLAVGPRVPDLPERYTQKSLRLPDITDPSMGGLVNDGTQTDIKYNELSYRYNELVDIYNCVKTSINNDEKSVSTCFK